MPESHLDANGFVIPTNETPEHRTPQAITACELCDNDGTRNGFPCHHTNTAETARRGIAQIRAQMGWTQPTTEKP